MHLAALTGLRFARSPSHFGGLADLLLSALPAADGFWQIVSGLFFAAFQQRVKGQNKISSASQGRVFIPRPFFFSIERFVEII